MPLLETASSPVLVGPGAGVQLVVLEVEVHEEVKRKYIRPSGASLIIPDPQFSSLGFLRRSRQSAYRFLIPILIARSPSRRLDCSAGPYTRRRSRR